MSLHNCQLSSHFLLWCVAELKIRAHVLLCGWNRGFFIVLFLYRQLFTWSCNSVPLNHSPVMQQSRYRRFCFVFAVKKIGFGIFSVTGTVLRHNFFLHLDFLWNTSYAVKDVSSQNWVTCLIANDLSLLHFSVILWCPHQRNSTWLFVSLPYLEGNLIRLSESAL